MITHMNRKTDSSGRKEPLTIPTIRTKTCHSPLQPLHDHNNANNDESDSTHHIHNKSIRDRTRDSPFSAAARSRSQTSVSSCSTRSAMSPSQEPKKHVTGEQAARIIHFHHTSLTPGELSRRLGIFPCSLLVLFLQHSETTPLP